MKALVNLVLLVALVACSGGTTTGNPVQVDLRLVDVQPFAWWRPIKNTILIPEARAAVSNVYFCFKRLRFKYDNSVGAGGSGDFDLSLGRVAIDPNGTTVGSFTISAGTYERIEIDLDKECDGVASRPSVEFTNGINPFNYSSQDNITIKFEGYFVASANQTVDLNIDLLLDEMDTITLADDIKDSLEAVTGDY